MSNDAKIADVCLVLEGTYPYVQGGVSSWVHQILTELPDVTFALFFLGSTRAQVVKKRYTPPANVISLTEVFLFEPLPAAELVANKIPAALRDTVYEALRAFYLAPDDSARMAAFWCVIDLLDAATNAGTPFTFGNLCRDEEAWALLLEVCQKVAPDESFIDFFWAVRFVHLPVWIALSSRGNLPAARMYHSVSTGYAGAKLPT
jgi:hypothetical protein